MPRPGVDVEIGTVQEQTGLSTDIATRFLIINAERGPIDRPVEITRKDQVATVFGARVAGAGTDSIETQIGEAPDARIFAIRLDDGGDAASAQAGPVEIRAASPGKWGEDLTVEIAPAGEIVTAGIVDSSLPELTLGGGSPPIPSPEEPEEENGPEEPGGLFALAVYYKGEVVERALSLTDADSLVAWAEESSDYIRASAQDGTAPLAAGVEELTGGSDGLRPVTDPQKLLIAAMACGDEELGLAGMLIAPGAYSAVQHEALLRAGIETNRRAALQADPALDIPGLLAHVALLRTLDMAQAMGGVWSQRLFIPGLASGTRRIVDCAAAVAALTARNANGNQSAAGNWGVCQWATGLDKQYTARERELLMHGGVNTFTMRDGRPRNMGYRTIAAEGGQFRQWLFLANSRLAMEIKGRGTEIGDRFLFENNTPQTISNFLGALAAMVGEYWPEALYGNSAEEAFEIVDTNTRETIAAGERHAGIRLRMGTPAEWIYIAIDKAPLTTQFAAPVAATAE